MIPAATAGRFVHPRRTLLDCGFGLVVPTSTESRAASGRELVDPGGPVIQTRIHLFISPLWFMLRWFAAERLTHINHAAPDSFSIGYGFRYRPCMSLVQPDQ
jgi:hypothetical protein